MSNIPQDGTVTVKYHALSTGEDTVLTVDPDGKFTLPDPTTPGGSFTITTTVNGLASDTTRALTVLPKLNPELQLPDTVDLGDGITLSIVNHSDFAPFVQYTYTQT